MTIGDSSLFELSDQETEVAEFIRFLDGARHMESVQQQKRLILDLLDPRSGEKVLDIGCGTGDDVRAMAEYVGPTGLSVGVDSWSAMIAEAARRTAEMPLPVEFHLGDIHQLDFAENTFDAVWAERLFEHLDHPKLALAEMIRVTKPGGRIVVASPDMDSNLIDHPDVIVTRKIRHFECDRRPNGRAGQRLYGWFREAGLTHVRAQAVAHIVTDYSDAVSALGIRERAQDVREAGVITPEECTTWLEQLDAAGQAGRFFMSTTHFIVKGRKP